MNNCQNIGLLFYKRYFNDIDFSKMESKENENKLRIVNDAITSSPLKPVKLNLEPMAIIDFTLTTIYPGLLIGSGYSHESSVKGELKLGFFFDYTTGLPCIPGSSVKGILRDACTKAKGKYVISILNELHDRNGTAEEKENADWLNKNNRIDEIFKCPGDDKDSEFILHVFEGKKDKDDFLPFKERDIFFDAFPVDSSNKNKIFLGNDYITPHKHSKDPKLDPFTNPTPIQFMKILPQVKIQFNFHLTGKVGDKDFPVNVKKELFRQILLDLGVGAKTNVGYGALK